MTEAIRQKLHDSLVEHFEFDEGEGLDSFGSHQNVEANLDGVSGSSAEVKWGTPILGAAAIEYNDAFGTQCCSTAGGAVAETFSLESRSGWCSLWMQTSTGYLSNRSDVSKRICNNGDQFFLNFWDSEIKNGNTNPAPGAVRVRLKDASGNFFSVTSDPIPLDEPVLLTWSWDRDANKLELWVNKTLAGEASSPLSAPVTLDGPGQVRWIGEVSSTSGLPTVLEGKVDNSIFGTGTLEQQDVDWLYNDGEGRTYSQMLAPDPPSPEEIFRATFADAFGRDPQPTALRVRSDARALAGHNVINYLYPPDYCRRTMYVRLEERELLTEGSMHWFKNERDPQFWMGRWAQIQGVRDTPDPTTVDLLLRIDDNPLSFIEP